MGEGVQHYDSFANNLRVAIESLLPVGVTDHCRLGVGFVVLRLKKASSKRLKSERRKAVTADFGTLDYAAVAILFTNKPIPLPSTKPRENALLILDLTVYCGGQERTWLGAEFSKL